jgi:hypothetical protein
MKCFPLTPAVIVNLVTFIALTHFFHVSMQSTLLYAYYPFFLSYATSLLNLATISNLATYSPYLLSMVLYRFFFQ